MFAWGSLALSSFYQFDTLRFSQVFLTQWAGLFRARMYADTHVQVAALCVCVRKCEVLAHCCCCCLPCGEWLIVELLIAFLRVKPDWSSSERREKRVSLDASPNILLLRMCAFMCAGPVLHPSEGHLIVWTAKTMRMTAFNSKKNKGPNFSSV